MCGDEGGEVPAGFTPWSRWLTLTRKTLAPFRTSTVVDNSWRGGCSCLRSPMRTEGRARKAVWGIPHTRPHTNDLQFPLAITLLQISHNWLWTEIYAGGFFLPRKAIISQRKRSSSQLQTGHVSKKSIIVDPATVQDCKVASFATFSSFLSIWFPSFQVPTPPSSIQSSYSSHCLSKAVSKLQNLLCFSPIGHPFVQFSALWIVSEKGVVNKFRWTSPVGWFAFLKSNH